MKALDTLKEYLEENEVTIKVRRDIAFYGIEMHFYSYYNSTQLTNLVNNLAPYYNPRHCELFVETPIKPIGDESALQDEIYAIIAIDVDGKYYEDLSDEVKEMLDNHCSENGEKTISYPVINDNFFEEHGYNTDNFSVEFKVAVLIEQHQRKTEKAASIIQDLFLKAEQELEKAGIKSLMMEELHDKIDTMLGGSYGGNKTPAIFSGHGNPLAIFGKDLSGLCQ